MKKILIGFVIVAGIIYSCKTNSTGTSATKRVNIVFEAKSNSKVSGEGSFVERNGVVTFKAKVKGLEPGVHAIHIHEKSDCSAADASSTGGHWNPTFKNHGKWGSADYHKGDIGNFTTDVHGEATIVFKTDDVMHIVTDFFWGNVVAFKTFFFVRVKGINNSLIK